MTKAEYDKVMEILKQAEREIAVRATQHKMHKGYEWSERAMKNLIETVEREIKPMVLALLMLVPGALLETMR